MPDNGKKFEDVEEMVIGFNSYHQDPNKSIHDSEIGRVGFKFASHGKGFIDLVKSMCLDDDELDELYSSDCLTDYECDQLFFYITNRT